MAEDAEMDRNTPHKQNRPIPSGIVSEEEARTLAWILSLFALIRGYLVNIRFGVMVTILLFFGIFYNLEPIRAKSRIISIPWQAASRGLLLFPTIWAAYGNPLDPVAWVLGTFTFLYVLGFQNSADIVDRHVDAEYGVKTFVVVFGVKRTVSIAFFCTALMPLVLIAGVEVIGVTSRIYNFLYVLPFCLYMARYMWKNPHEISDKTGNHPVWLWFYGVMVLIVALPLVVEVL